ncbi:MAG TPA: ABC transporter substrate-binding protein [Mycobacteriales bacterium]|jgi:iron complex transport system substrate-binding protein|nr:ABC transporter substrate-binding protein [Mycobacteriales bacterium]
MRTKLGAVIAAGLLVTVGLSACGSSSPSASATRPSGASTGAFPVTITSALGTATIKSVPERVVTIGWGSQDAALALGVVPVGMQDFSADSGSPDGILPWDRSKLGDAKPAMIKASTGSVPFEQIASLHPDVILAVYSGITAEEYARLSQIAPTVGYPDKAWLTSWQDQVTLVGKALGKSTQAAELIDKTDGLIAAAAAAHPEFQGKTIAFGSGTKPGSFNFYYDDDPRSALLQQLGFTPSPSVSKLGDGGSPNSFAKQVSLELLPGVQTDVLVAWYLAPATQHEIEDNGLFRSLPAVKSGSYVPLTDPPLVYATSAVNVLSLPWMLDRYLPLLSKAAKNVPG